MFADDCFCFFDTIQDQMFQGSKFNHEVAKCPSLVGDSICTINDSMMTSCNEQCGQAGDEPSILHVIVRTRSPQDQQFPHTTGDTDIFLIS
jgi:hypothetical protein